MGDAIPRLRDLLSEAASRAGIDRAAEAGALWSRWEEVVGPTIAQHAEPTSLRRGVLKIRADSPSWATELGYMREQVMTAANELLGSPVVSQVQVWTGPGTIRSKRVERAPEGGEQVVANGHREPPTDDPREAFERARSAWLKRRARRRDRGRSEAPGKPENPW